MFWKFGFGLFFAALNVPEQEPKENRCGYAEQDQTQPLEVITRNHRFDPPVGKQMKMHKQPSTNITQLTTDPPCLSWLPQQQPTTDPCLCRQTFSKQIPFAWSSWFGNRTKVG